MKDGIRVPRGSWRATSRRARSATAIMAMTGLALLATACSSSSSSSGSASAASSNSDYAKALSYAKCMRAHGLPNFPDPDNNGNFDGTTHEGINGGTGANDNVSDAVKNAAWDTCKSLLPSGNRLSRQKQQAAAGQFLAFAKCMRSHGVPNFPDPASSGGKLGLSAPQGIDTQSPVYQAAQSACQSQEPRK